MPHAPIFLLRRLRAAFVVGASLLFPPLPVVVAGSPWKLRSPTSAHLCILKTWCTVGIGGMMSDLDRLHEMIDLLPPQQVHALLTLLASPQPDRESVGLGKGGDFGGRR